jgi:predicted membrane-bound spermidine synthase
MIPWLERYRQVRKGNGINYIMQDPIDYLLNTDTRYDVVMLMLPDPTNLQINRYYTLEFFKSLRKSLSDTAFVYAGLSKESSRSQKMNSIVFYTMKKVFRYAILIPGANSHFLASGNILSIKLGAKAEKKGITLKHIDTNPADTLVRDRIESAMKNLTLAIKLNRDYHPGAFFTLVAATMPSMDGITIAVSLIVLLLTAIYLYKGKSKRIAVFLTGFTLLSVMVILLMSYQAMFGNLYFMLSILMGMIPAGIALGIFIYRYMEKNGNAPSVAALQVAIGSFSVVVLFFLLGIREITDYQPVITILYLILSLAGGTIAGMQLSAVIEKHKEEGEKLADSLHIALLLGMALGTLVGIALVFPVLGLILGCIILGVINAALGFLFY